MKLTGRRTIYTNAETITADNVVKEVNNAVVLHMQNVGDEDYLYNYRRGVTPIDERTKEVRPEICAKVNENHAEEIVSFKNGYFLTEPAYYVARKEDAAENVNQLNEFLYRSGKHIADNEIVDWFHTVGKAVLYVDVNDDTEVIKAYAIDPRQAFVVYSMRPGHKPIMGVNMVVTEDNDIIYDVFTETNVFKLYGGKTSGVVSPYTQRPQLTNANAISVQTIEPNYLRHIPIIEYKYNSTNMSAFEVVLPLLDAINQVMSNRLDGIDQFIQSLAIAVNCNFAEDVTANDIRKAGMLVLKSIGENKADFKILSEQLDQTQTQVLVDYLYQQVLTICGMPSTTKGGSSTSDTGVAVLGRDGWYQADVNARNTEDLFKASNRQFDAILIDVLKKKHLMDVDINDFELQIVRNELSNVQSKAQAFTTLVSGGFHPILAMQKSGVSNDPVADYKMSEEWFMARWSNPTAEDSTEENTNQDTEETEDGKNTD